VWRERIEDDRKIGKGLKQPDIGDVGDPDLVEPCRYKAAYQIGASTGLCPKVAE
jgi:hypothetical protein